MLEDGMLDSLEIKDPILLLFISLFFSQSFGFLGARVIPKRNVPQHWGYVVFLEPLCVEVFWRLAGDLGSI